jgi:hypothetical protein
MTQDSHKQLQYRLDVKRKIIATPDLKVCEPWVILKSTNYEGVLF